MILSPHIAGLTKESQARIACLVAEEVLKVLEGKESMFVVNEEET